MSQKLTDEEIVERVKKGKSELYGMIVEKYQVPLLRYVRRVINQAEEEVEDIVQEVFIKGYENIQSFDRSKKFSSWIYRIAHNVCIDFFRKKKPVDTTIEDSEELFESGEKLIEELAIEKEEKRAVIMAVEQLELKYREAVLLYYFEEKSYDEISDILHTNTSNVGVLLLRAREKLRKLL